MALCNKDIARVLEGAAPLCLQEGYDNCGWQVGSPDAECTGVMICVDPVPDRIAEAVAERCNLLVSHHPLLFHGLKRITGDTLVQQTVMDAIANGVSVYSLHTALDNAPDPWGVSLEMARMLSLTDVRPLDADSGAGAIGEVSLSDMLDLSGFVAKVKEAFGSPIVRASDPSLAPYASSQIRRVALCGGSGSSLIDMAIAAGADVMLTSDISYHRFVDYASKIQLVDIGHFESERCTKSIIYRIISQNFPNFVAKLSQQESNPITYL
jgi:dinuclear metal center protein, YbgI family